MKQQRQTLTFFSLAVALTMVALPPATAITDDNLIIPGQSIGQTHLGRNGGFYLNKLPKAAAFDPGMQQTQTVWVSKNKGRRSDTLYIHTISNAALFNQEMPGVFIDEIQITSPWFHTPEGISTGSTRAQILRYFPNVRPLSGGTEMSDNAKGIAFGFANSATDAPCISIGVYPPGRDGGITEQETINDLLRNSPTAY